MDLDVSVQASLNENLGGTIESLLMARPTVATRVGGMVDSVIDGRTGILVRPEDPEDLARGMIELIRDRERAAALGRAGRELMLSKFTLSTTVPALVAIYRLQRASAPGAFRLHVGALRVVLASRRFSSPAPSSTMSLLPCFRPGWRGCGAVDRASEKSEPARPH
jgi:hypothetical protein